MPHCFDSDVSSPEILSRKVFSSNLAHLSIVFFWLAGMYFHGAYFSNYTSWLTDPVNIQPTSQLVWSVVGQDIQNSYSGHFNSGVSMTSGFFQIWRSHGITTRNQLVSITFLLLVLSFFCLGASYWHQLNNFHVTALTKKLGSLALHHVTILIGLASISWSGHLIHVSLPINSLLDSQISPSYFSIDPPTLLGNVDLMQVIFPGFGGNFLPDFSIYLPGISVLGSSNFLLSPNTGCIYLGQIAAHHYYLGVVSILTGVILYAFRVTGLNSNITSIQTSPSPTQSLNASANSTSTWHSQLAFNLAFLGSASIYYAYCSSLVPVYPYLSVSYPTLTSLFYHHLWIGGFFILGCAAHATISYLNQTSVIQLISHREMMISHLSWVSIFLGFHSFGLYIHNDTLQSLGSPSSTFSDNSIQLKPIFANLIASSYLNLGSFLGISSIEGKLSRVNLELGTSDFLVTHIHAFTIHVTLLILLKGAVFARSSRLVSDKLYLGYSYPCDGPGRGGTCQISPWDHLFLASFWLYNSVSVILFSFFWKQQSDIWGYYSASTNSITHLTNGDFSNSFTINAWLRDFLWSQSSQAIQSYSSDGVCSFGFLFIAAHFVWAFSLMFLFSGRGYWQELIESILYAHSKLRVVPYVQPRALSISQGRLVGLVHYILGGIGVTWSFVLSRILVLSS